MKSFCAIILLAILIQGLRGSTKTKNGGIPLVKYRVGGKECRWETAERAEMGYLIQDAFFGHVLRL